MFVPKKTSTPCYSIILTYLHIFQLGSQFDLEQFDRNDKKKSSLDELGVGKHIMAVIGFIQTDISFWSFMPLL